MGWLYGHRDLIRGGSWVGSAPCRRFVDPADACSRAWRRRHLGCPVKCTASELLVPRPTWDGGGRGGREGARCRGCPYARTGKAPAVPVVIRCLRSTWEVSN